VWKVLERKVRIDERYVGLDRWDFPEGFRDLQEAREYYREQCEVKRLEEELAEKGTPRDKLILELVTTINLQLGSGNPAYRALSQEEFQNLRSQVEPMSEEQIAEKIREQNEYYRHLGKETGVFDEPKEKNACIVGYLMPSPEEVDRRLVAGEITEEEARQQKKKVFRRHRMYMEEDLIQMMHEEALITREELRELIRLNRTGLGLKK
jgi:hypothetical protein